MTNAKDDNYKAFYALSDILRDFSIASVSTGHIANVMVSCFV